jgi:tetraacyldisaccharide-1-P 4'-kinase
MDNAERLSSSSIPLISVGNFTFGGTGKTPFVIYLADMILKCTLSKSVGNEPSNCIHNSHKIVDKVPLLLTRVSSTFMSKKKKKKY